MVRASSSEPPGSSLFERSKGPTGAFFFVRVFRRGGIVLMYSPQKGASSLFTGGEWRGELRGVSLGLGELRGQHHPNPGIFSFGR